MMRVLSWIGSKARGVTGQHLEGFGVATIIFVGYLCIRDIVKKRKEKPVFHRCQTLKALHGGRQALERLLDTQHARLNPSVLETAEQQLEKALENVDTNPCPDFMALQEALARLEMTGKEDKALDKLKEALRKNLNDVQKAYELDMCIAELLIYMGNYKEALTQECFAHEQITDARRPLYKTIIYVMLDQVEDAKASWAEYERVRDLFQVIDVPPCGLLHEISHDFESFKRVVANLKKEIEDARKKKNVM